MSRAEEKALEQYPVEMYEDVGWRCVDKNEYKRQYFIEGYHQAEKDLELTWEDIKIIVDAFLDLKIESVKSGKTEKHTDEEYCREVLKRFKSYGKKNG